MKKIVKICLKLQFYKFFFKFWPPDWTPQEQSLGQILDKFGVRGVFECCKGKKVSQHKGSHADLRGQLSVETCHEAIGSLLVERGFHLDASLVLAIVGNGRNTVSRVLFRRREFTEFRGKLGEFCAKLGEFAFSPK